MRLGMYMAGNSKKGGKKPKGERAESPPVFPEIEYPKEIQLLDELNEANREEYEKWLYKKMLTEKILGTSTLIIGVRGKDGIVLGGDTKAASGTEAAFEKKVKTIPTVQKAPIIFAAAGTVGIIDDFIETFQETVTASIQEGKITSLRSIKVIAEDLVKKFEERYGPRLGQYPLHFIFGGLSALKAEEARLYEIGPGGVGQKIKYSSLVGHGSPYARTIGKYLFHQNSKTGMIPLECKDIVSRIAACIYWIREEIDDSVGGEPQIVYVLDKEPEVREGRFNKERIIKEIDRLKKTLKNIFQTEKDG